MSCCSGHSLNSLSELGVSCHMQDSSWLWLCIWLLEGVLENPFFPELVWFGSCIWCAKSTWILINNLVLLTCTTLLLKKLECVRIELVLWLFKTKNIYLSSVFCFVMMGALFREVLNQLTCFSRSGFHHMMVVFYEGITLNLKLITDFWI